MLTILSILIFLTCCLLVLAVLVQNPKGGGLASGFQSGSQVMGVRRTADFLEKATWVLAVSLLVMSVLATTIAKSSGEGVETPSSSTKDKATDFDAQPGAGGTGGGVPLGGAPTTPAK